MKWAQASKGEETADILKAKETLETISRMVIQLSNVLYNIRIDTHDGVKASSVYSKWFCFSPKLFRVYHLKYYAPVLKKMS